MNTKQLAVQFGNVNCGDITARLACKVSRKSLSLDEADALLTNRTLTVIVDQQELGEQNRTLFDDERPSIDASCQSKTFTTAAKHFTFGLTFNLQDVDVPTLTQFAKRTGRVVITDVRELDPPKRKKSDHPDVSPGEDRHSHKGQPALRATAAEHARRDEGAKLPLTAMIEHGMTAKKLEIVESACDGSTIGDLEKWFRADPYWPSKLKGFGETWITKLQDAHLAVRQQYPMPSDEPEPEPEDQSEPDDSEIQQAFGGMDLSPALLTRIVAVGPVDAFELDMVYGDTETWPEFVRTGEFSADERQAIESAVLAWQDSAERTEALLAAKAEGREACTAGEDHDANPYAAQDERAVAWGAGWVETHRPDIFEASAK